jgi:hypothetical protein
MDPFGVSDAVWLQWRTAFITVNVVVLALLVLAYWKPVFTRVLLAGALVVAGLLNIRMALGHPHSFIELSRFTLVAPLHAFIVGPFAVHPGLWVLPIALGQIACGLMLGLGLGPVARWGCVGATVFLLAITPLGFGAAFPAPLILAAVFVFLRAELPEESLPELFRARAGEPSLAAVRT